MKKLLSMALALCLVLALTACGGSGDPDSTPSPTNYDGATPSDLMPATSPTPTPEPESITTLEINGIHLIKDGQITGTGFKGFTYEDGTLTIDSVELESESADTPIILVEGGAIEIIVKGESSLSISGGASVISAGDSDVTFSGDGSLALSAADAPAIDTSGDVVFGCALAASGSDACTSENVSAASGWTLTDDGATLTVAAA